ncbi:MAG: type II toxin-antitoxin system RelE/ParE family toxin [Elusimicrobiota bacterium]|nr:type II toxin-antitoxin system RelE/ParE family toxin [Elusimicrobiota bacterium]
MFTLNYHPDARAGIISIPANMKARISKAIETRLTTAPDKYGKPLRGSLAGHRRLRVGDYRIVYRVVGNTVRILEIAYRGNVKHYD